MIHSGIYGQFTQTYKSMESTFRSNWKERCQVSLWLSAKPSSLWVKHSWPRAFSHRTASCALQSSTGGGGGTIHFTAMKLTCPISVQCTVYMAVPARYSHTKFPCHLIERRKGRCAEERRFALRLNLCLVFPFMLWLTRGKSCDLSEPWFPSLQKRKYF